MLDRLGKGGAYHAAVEVYGREWSFGATEDGSSGVFCCRPRQCPDHTYLKALPMGHTQLAESQVLALIGRTRKEWQGDDYDLLHCNCCHYSEDLLSRLGAGPAPGWLTSLAATGAVLDDQVAAATATAALAKSAGNDAASRVGDALRRSGGSDRAIAAREKLRISALGAAAKVTASAKFASGVYHGAGWPTEVLNTGTYARCH